MFIISRFFYFRGSNERSSDIHVELWSKVLHEHKYSYNTTCYNYLNQNMSPITCNLRSKLLQGHERTK